MSEIESGQLILDTTKATSRTLVNTVNTILFKNVNIREVLGDMYDKYDKFKICLNGMQMTGASITDRICFIRMSGLNWVGELGYNDNDVTKALITMEYINAGASNSLYNCNYGSVFNKPSNNTVDITLHLGDVLTNGNLYWNYREFIFYFSIFGVI